MYKARVPSRISPNTPVKPNLGSEGPKTGKYYELLWRKKKAKLHKTWEGDAKGYLTPLGTGWELIVHCDNGVTLGGLKLSKDAATLSEGTILSIGSYEVEVGCVLATPENTPKREYKETKEFQQEGWKKLNATSTLKPLHRTLGTTASGNAAKKPKHCVPEKPHTETDTEALNQKKKTVVQSLGMIPAFKMPTKGVSGGAKGNIPGIPDEDIDQNLKAKMRPHQIEGVQFMRRAVLGLKHNLGNGCILADEMGLGKTLTSIALVHTLLKNKEIKNALIICPVTLITNWKNEFQKWLLPFAPQPVRPAVGVMAIDQNGWGNSSLKDPVSAFFGDRYFKMHQVMIVGYERVRLLSTQLVSRGNQFDLVICDEGHRLKSTNSKTAESIDSICSEKRVILTGTPVQNELNELWALANFVNPGCFGSEAKFMRKFAVPIYAEYKSSSAKSLTDRNDDEAGDDDDDYDNDDEDEDDNTNDTNDNDEDKSSGWRVAKTNYILEEDHAHLRTREKAEESITELTEICDEFILRRTSSVMEQYIKVPKEEYVVFCRPTKQQSIYYKSLLNGFSDLVAGLSEGSTDQGACLRAISQLRKAANGSAENNGGKLHMLSALIDETRGQTDEKMVIVSGSTRVLDMCQHLCTGKGISWLRLDGSTPQEKRQSSVNLYNKLSSSSAFAFLLSSRSGGMGLNLIGGSRLVLLDCDWNPAIDAQVMSRIHRDGQKRRCYIYRLLTTGTIDEKIFQRQLTKIGLTTNVLLGSSLMAKSEFSTEVLRDLFTFTYPKKCNTLESSSSTEAEIKGYRELTKEKDGGGALDNVLIDAAAKADNVSCILIK